MKVQRSKLDVETGIALAATLFSVLLLVVTALYAGPLWRDEINTLNLAQMPGLKELWNDLPCESFPPLWPLLLRGYAFLGLAGSDAGVRLLGLYVGMAFLASLWICSRWIGARAPIMTLALLGGLPAFIFIVGANRAYGLASCLLVLSFGSIWRLVDRPSKSRILVAGLVCVLFAQCVYYDLMLLGAILAGAAVVVIRRRQWRVLLALAAIGAVSGASMMVYLPIIRGSSAYVRMNQEPSFHFSTLWHQIGNTLSERTSAFPDGSPRLTLWLWLGILVAGATTALAAQRNREALMPAGEPGPAMVRTRADLALFSLVSLVLGISGVLFFLLRLQFITQAWYYVELLCLCAIALDGIFSAGWPALRPWGWLRIGFLVLMLALAAGPGWQEAHTRRSNVDLIAAALSRQAATNDLIVVQGPWEGITFNRYYHGQTRWLTLPPFDSHQLHRNDLAREMMDRPDPMAPVIRQIAATLRGGNSVWMVGDMAVMPPGQTPPSAQSTHWWLAYLNYWSAQVTVFLQDHAAQEQILEFSVPQPVSQFEKLPVRKFSGYRPDAGAGSTR